MKHTDKHTLQGWTFETVPRDEQETTAVIDHKEKHVLLYSCHPATVEKMRKWASEYADAVQIRSYDQYGINLTVPVSWMKIKPPRQYTEAQKQAMRDRLKNAPEIGIKTEPHDKDAQEPHSERTA